MQFIFFLAVGLIVIFVSFQLRRRYELAQQLRVVGLSPDLLRVIGLVALGAAAFQTISIIDAGTVGVVKVFGKVNPAPLREGINIRNPFAEIVSMNIKTQRRH